MNVYADDDPDFEIDNETETTDTDDELIAAKKETFISAMRERKDKMLKQKKVRQNAVAKLFREIYNSKLWDVFLMQWPHV